MKTFDKNLPKEFRTPTSLPKSEEERREWQKTNYDWWQNQPMRYDWKQKIPFPEFTKEFYSEIDKRFFKNAEEYLPLEKIPFDILIDFDSLRGKSVLEIGVGNGSHAGLLARYAGSFTGIDLTDYAVKSTRNRMEVFGLQGTILKMDAEKLEFPDETFDFVWSWGVIHHSANTGKILKEVHRVLRPRGEAVIMVYHRGWWNYYVIGFLRGLLSGKIFRHKSLHAAVQLFTDGAIARYYRPSEFKKLCGDLFMVEKKTILGPKSDFILLPGGRLKDLIESIVPNAASRFLTKNLLMGVFLVFRLRKI